jgi:hypothetical protein
MTTLLFGMNLLHPWAIAIGAAAILLPLVIHFLTKPRPKSMPLSTIRFVQAAVQQSRARNWLRDLLVLLLRGLAIAALAWAFAQPRFDAELASLSDASAKIQRVVILDASQSMSATDSGVDGFQSARVQAARHLKYSPGLAANLIVAAAEPQSIFETTSPNLQVLTTALADVTALPQRIDVQAAIHRAAEMLAGGESEKSFEDDEIQRELVIVSDFQRTNWATVDFSALPKTTQIRLESTAPETAPENLAILSVGFSEKPTAGNTATLEIAIGNYSANPQNARIEIELGANVAVIEVACPANTRTIATHEMVFPESGWQSGWAKLLDHTDALPADDRFPFVAQAIATPMAKLITRQSPSMKPSSSYFLERALSPFDPPVPGQMQVQRISPGRFNLSAVADSQLLIFDHPGKLKAEQIETLASLIRRGRGVLYVASETVDATNLKILYDQLGGDLTAPVELVPSPRGVKRRELSITDVKQKLRPFSVFGDTLTAMLADLRISGGLATRRLPDSLNDEILATLSDQSALLFASPVGLGNLCVLNVDLEASNWPRHPSFVPVVSELIDVLLRSHNRSQTAFCGESLTRVLPPEITGTAGLVVSSKVAATSSTDASASNRDGQSKNAASEENVFGEFRQSGDGVVWNWPRMTGPSIFEINNESGSSTAGNDKAKAQTVYAIASNIPPEESDLRTLDAELLTDRLSGGREVAFHRVTDSDSKNDKTWVWFAVAAIVALVGEVFVLKRFRV